MNLSHRAKTLLVALVVMNMFGIACLLSEVTDKDSTFVTGNAMGKGEHLQYGVLDNGDQVYYEKVAGHDDLITYFMGREANEKRYGDYGDVIVFKPKNSEQKFAHRPLCYVFFNFTSSNVSGDIPELGLFGAQSVNFSNMGYPLRGVSLNFTNLYDVQQSKGVNYTQGYLTIGDNNRHVDQEVMPVLISLNDIHGKVVRVLDNEMGVNTPLEVGVLIGFIISLLIFNGYTFFKKGVIKEETYPRGWFLLVLLVIIAKAAIFFFRSGELTDFEAFMLTIQVVLFLVITRGCFRLVSRWKDDGYLHKRSYMYALFFLLIPTYALYRFEFINIYLSLPVIISVYALFALRINDYIVANTYKINPNKYYMWTVQQFAMGCILFSTVLFGMNMQFHLVFGMIFFNIAIMDPLWQELWKLPSQNCDVV